MVIHTMTKENQAGLIVGIPFSILWIMYIVLEDDPILGGFMLFMVIISFIYPWIFLFRTLIMDEKGCTIRALWGERHYTWEEFAVKRLEEHEVTEGYHRNTKGYVAFFSVHPVKKKPKKQPVYYWGYHHPFSLTMFAFQFAIKKEFIFEPGYEEKYFREKMKEWNVELEEVRMRDWEKKK